LQTYVHKIKILHPKLYFHFVNLAQALGYFCVLLLSISAMLP
jgi:hypothetical protein